MNNFNEEKLPKSGAMTPYYPRKKRQQTEFSNVANINFETSSLVDGWMSTSMSHKK